MRKTLPLLLLVSLLISTSSCGTTAPRVVLVPEKVSTEDGIKSNVIRVGEPVEAFVYVWDDATGEWLKSAKRVTIPEGWLAGPPPPAKEHP